MTKLMIMLTALLVFAASPRLAHAQSGDVSAGRHLAETVCSACHDVNAISLPFSPKSGAPRFADISRMPSTTELEIKVFLRTSHSHMPNIILSPAETDDVAAYIVDLARH